MKSFLQIVLAFLIINISSFQIYGQLISVSKNADVSFASKEGDVITYNLSSMYSSQI